MTYQPKEPISCVRCGRQTAVARRLCRACYTSEHRRKNLAQYRILGPQDVFQSKIAKVGDCWNWTGTKNSYGYGIFLMPGERPVRAHRYSYETNKGPIPPGMVVMHSCDNPACVNPAHLSVGTKADNNRDRKMKNRAPKGEGHALARLTAQQVLEIRASPLPYSEIADMFGIDPSHVSNIKNRKAWAHLP